MEPWFTAVLMTMILLTNLFCVPGTGEHQDMICAHTELPAFVISDGGNQTCLLPLLPLVFNNSTISASEFEIKMNVTDETTTGRQISLIDTGRISKETFESFSLVVSLILAPIITILGLVGNILSLVTLLSLKPRDTITIYLINLCVADSLTIACSFITSIARIIPRYDVILGLKARMFTFTWIEVFASAIASRGSGFITVVLSLERMIAVKLPFVVKETFLNRHPWKIVLGVWVFMVLLFFPNFFRYDVSIRTNALNNQSYFSVSPSQFAKSSEFYLYLGTAGQILVRIVPMVIVLVCNLVIVITLRASVRYRKRMISTGVEDHKTTRLLLTISAIFLFCTIPGTANGILIKFVDSYGFFKQEHYLFTAISGLGGFLDILNSSINFVVYILLGSNFRAAFFKIWGMKCRQIKRVDQCQSSRTKTESLRKV